MNSRLISLAEQAADEAARVIRPYFRAHPASWIKPDESPVTQADQEAERAMRALIAQACPDHAILGEEDGLQNAGQPWCWVLDPIDGTRAFITGRPIFGTLIALLREGRPVLGIIDQCITGERWVGVYGQPTCFRGPLGGRIGTRACADLSQAELSATSPDMFAEAAPRFAQLSRAVRRTSWGGDCYAYGLLALGQIDIIAERAMKPWDWAALVPVIEGAGGRVTDWSGNPLTLHSAGDVLAVGDPNLLAAAVSVLSA